MADRLYTSSEADEVLSALRFETKLEKATLARIAFTLSLVKDGAAVPPSPSFSGGELKRPTFIAEDEVFLRTLIAHTYGKREFSEDEFYSNRSIVKNHIDSGAALLAKMFQETGRSGDAEMPRSGDAAPNFLMKCCGSRAGALEAPISERPIGVLYPSVVSG